MYKRHVWRLLVCQSVSYGLIVHQNSAFEELVPIFVGFLSNLTEIIGCLKKNAGFKTAINKINFFKKNNKNISFSLEVKV
jgi:hypothetical protein